MMTSLKHVIAGGVGIAVIATASICLVWRCQVRNAIAEVERLNGAVDDRGDPFLGPQGVTFAVIGREQVLDDSRLQGLLPSLRHFRTLKTLDLSGTSLTPDALKGIGQLTKLTRLDLPAACISEKSIPTLADLKHLEALYLYGPSPPAAILERLRRLLPATRIQIDHSRWSQPLP
jgi:hypothetical protein